MPWLSKAQTSGKSPAGLWAYTLNAYPRSHSAIPTNSANAIGYWIKAAIMFRLDAIALSLTKV